MGDDGMDEEDGAAADAAAAEAGGAGGAGGEVEVWPSARLRVALAARGARVRTPVEHRDRWLARIAARVPSTFQLGLGRDELPDGFLDAALDAAAGVLMELPRLEEDAWRGWVDPRFAKVLGVLRMAELPKDPPRLALRVAWDELRQAVPFELVAPRPGQEAHSLRPLRTAIETYLDALDLEVDLIPPVVVEEEPQPAIAEAVPPMPRALLEARLRDAVTRHVNRVRQWMIPLADDLYWEAFASQRSAASLNRRRGDQARLHEGRALRARSKLRYHLAAWTLKQARLARVDIGLFLHHVDASGLQAALPATVDDAWRARLEKEVDNALAYWTSDSRSSGDPPSVHLAHIEEELHDLLRPVQVRPPGP